MINKERMNYNSFLYRTITLKLNFSKWAVAGVYMRRRRTVILTNNYYYNYCYLFYSWATMLCHIQSLTSLLFFFCLPTKGNFGPLLHRVLESQSQWLTKSRHKTLDWKQTSVRQPVSALGLRYIISQWLIFRHTRGKCPDITLFTQLEHKAPSKVNMQ